MQHRGVARNLLGGKTGGLGTEDPQRGPAPGPGAEPRWRSGVEAPEAGDILNAQRSFNGENK